MANQLGKHPNERYVGKYFAPMLDRQLIADAIAEWLTSLREDMTGKDWFVGEWTAIQYPDGGLTVIAYTFEL